MFNAHLAMHVVFWHFEAVEGENLASDMIIWPPL